jgi:hypothetical protein
VLRLVSGDNSNKEIAAQLSITEEAVKGPQPPNGSDNALAAALARDARGTPRCYTHPVVYRLCSVPVSG